MGAALKRLNFPPRSGRILARAPHVPALPNARAGQRQFSIGSRTAFDGWTQVVGEISSPFSIRCATLRSGEIGEIRPSSSSSF